MESSIESLDYALLSSFEVGHILVLFIAFAFMLQVISLHANSFISILFYLLIHLGDVFDAICTFHVKDILEGCSDWIIRHRGRLQQDDY